jgi:predicted choloylglycine hydrolase
MGDKQMKVHILVTKGNAYEAGYQLGQKLKDNTELIHFMTSPFMGGPELTNEQFGKVREQFELYSPGLSEEIRGFADAVGAEQRQVVYNFVYLQLPPGGCSQIAFTPDVTVDGMAYLGRNYDFGWGEQPYLMDTQIEGQYRHIGVACQLFGRFDGMNEKGLCVATSAGEIGPNYKEGGFVFPFIVRTLLGQCKDVSEAEDLLRKLPMADYRNYIVMDKSGKALLVETAGSKMKMRYSDTGTLYATNHYNLLENEHGVYAHSLTRYHRISEYLSDKLSKKESRLSEDDMIKILTEPYPNGTCCQFYKDGMGTLWSVVMNPMKCEMKICFGTPGYNEWYTIDFIEDSAEKEINANLLNLSVADGFWKKVNK